MFSIVGCPTNYCIFSCDIPIPLWHALLILGGWLGKLFRPVEHTPGHLRWSEKGFRNHKRGVGGAWGMLQSYVQISLEDAHPTQQAD